MSEGPETAADGQTVAIEAVLQGCAGFVISDPNSAKKN